MLLLVTINLSKADIVLFESYEKTVLSLLPKYGAKLESQLRATDNSREVHLLSFPDIKSHQAYLEDGDRLRARSIWDKCGAEASSIEVTDIR